MRGAGFRLTLWGVLLGLAVAGLMSIDMQGEALGAALLQVSTGALGICLAGTGLNAALRSLRWHALLRELGWRLSLSRTVTVFLSGFAFTLTPARSGEAVRALLHRRDAVPYSHTLGLCAADRVLDVVVVAALGLLALWHLPGAPWTIVAVGGALCGVLYGLRSERVAGWIRPRLEWRGRFRRWGEAARRGLSALRAIFKGARLPTILGLSGIAWLAEASGVWLLLRELEPGLGWSLAVSIYAAGLLAGALSTLPGGLIGVEATMLLLLIRAGMDAELAAVGILLARVCTLGFSLLVGVSALGLERLDRGFQMIGRRRGSTRSI